MYRQPENYNHVKTIKNRFEGLNTPNTNDKTKKTMKNINITKTSPNKASTSINSKIIIDKSKLKENNNNDYKNNFTSLEMNSKENQKSKAKHDENFRIQKGKFIDETTDDKDFSHVNKKELCNIPPLNLTRQLNDPSKKGCIKRTPAFRKEKLVGKVKTSEDLNFASIVQLFENNNTSDCDNINKNIESQDKSTTSDNFIKVNMKNEDIILNEADIENDNLKLEISLEDIKPNVLFEMENKIDALLVEQSKQRTFNSDKLEVIEENVNENIKVSAATYAQVVKPKKTATDSAAASGLTDTLKAALKQPLPTGPPPKKPPRTFAHMSNSKNNLPNSDESSSIVESNSKQKHTHSVNNAFCDKLSESLAKRMENKHSETDKKMTKIKSDPKLMLQKLENALMNNKIRSPKLPKKLKPTAAAAATQPNIYTVETPQKHLFPNCLPSLNCASKTSVSNAYAKITPASQTTTSSSSLSTFFIESKMKNEEPVYAEPFAFQVQNESVENLSKIESPTISNGLHYMSNPVCEKHWTITDANGGPIASVDKDGCSGNNNNSSSVCAAKESESDYRRKLNLIMNHIYDSPTTPTDSDVESLPSSNEDTSSLSASTTKRNTIKDLIHVFEQKHQLEPDALNTTRKPKEKLSISHSWQDNTTNRTIDNKTLTRNDSHPVGGEENKKYQAQLHRTLTDIRKTYVRKICSTLKRKSDSDKQGPHLFECCLLVGLNVSDSTPYIKNKYPSNYEVPPWVAHLCFPDATEWSDKSTSNANFDSQNCQCYSLVITNERGDRKFGYCRRVVPEEASVCLPLTYCIISNFRATGFYHKVLRELESRHGLPFWLQDAFVRELYKCKFPQPGESVKISCLLRTLVKNSCEEMISNQPDKLNSVQGFLNNMQNNGVYAKVNTKSDEQRKSDSEWVLLQENFYENLNNFRRPKNTYPNNNNSKRNGQVFEDLNITETNKDDDNFIASCSSPLNLSNNQLLYDCLLGDMILKRPYDSRLEDIDLTELFNHLDFVTLLQIFGSLLHERKVIFVSSCLSKLSSCVEALQSILYPFSWQHTFIPVLSSNMLDVLSAPLPLIAGILASHITETLIIEEGIAVNLDRSEIVCYMGDESEIIPKQLQRSLTASLQLVKDATGAQDSSRNVLVSDAFIRMFVELCGYYKQYITTTDDKTSGEKTFQKEAFIKHHKSSSIHMFLEWFTETAMFNHFIQARCDGEHLESIFEMKCLELSKEKLVASSQSKNSSRVTRKMKHFGQKLFN